MPSFPKLSSILNSGSPNKNQNIESPASPSSGPISATSGPSDEANSIPTTKSSSSSSLLSIGRNKTPRTSTDSSKLSSSGSSVTQERVTPPQQDLSYLSPSQNIKPYSTISSAGSGSAPSSPAKSNSSPSRLSKALRLPGSRQSSISFAEVTETTTEVNRLSQRETAINASSSYPGVSSDNSLLGGDETGSLSRTIGKSPTARSKRASPKPNNSSGLVAESKSPANATACTLPDHLDSLPSGKVTGNEYASPHKPSQAEFTPVASSDLKGAPPINRIETVRAVPQSPPARSDSLKTTVKVSDPASSATAPSVYQRSRNISIISEPTNGISSGYSAKHPHSQPQQPSAIQHSRSRASTGSSLSQIITVNGQAMSPSDFDDIATPTATRYERGYMETRPLDQEQGQSYARETPRIDQDGHPIGGMPTVPMTDPAGPNGFARFGDIQSGVGTGPTQSSSMNNIASVENGTPTVGSPGLNNGGRPASMYVSRPSPDASANGNGAYLSSPSASGGPMNLTSPLGAVASAPGPSSGGLRPETAEQSRRRSSSSSHRSLPPVTGKPGGEGMVPAGSQDAGPSLLDKVKKKVKGRRSRKHTSASHLTTGSGDTGSKARPRALSSASHTSAESKDSSLFHDDDEEDEDDETGSEDLDDDDDYSISESRSSWHSKASLPVTGFAVASNRRNADFHAMFPEIDEGDYLIEDYGCALQKDILVQGRIYVSEHHLSFHANIFGWVTNAVIPFKDVISLEKKMTAFVIPNAISVISKGGRQFTFSSFISRDSTYDVFANVWRQSHSSSSTDDEADGENGAIEGVVQPKTQVSKGASNVAHMPTQCACGKANEHYTETAMEAIFPSSPENVCNLMFTSPFLKDFMANDQKLMDIQMSDWQSSQDGDQKVLKRNMSYIKPLNGSIGPKQTKCEIVDQTDHNDPDNYISMITTTRTPEVPSGTVFSVKTRTCLTWAGPWSTKVLVTTQVDWTGRSFIKGIIEKSAVDGQKTYHSALEKRMRKYMKEHPSEFKGEGVEEEAAEEEVAVQATEEEKKEISQEEVARAARKKRVEDDQTALQFAFDSIITGTKTLVGGVVTAGEMLGDLLSDFPIPRKQLLFGLIIFLVLTNFWTYSSLRSVKNKVIRDPKGVRLSDSAADDAVKRYMETIIGQQTINVASACKDTASLLKTLEEIESRVQRTRQALVNAAALDTLE